jgi:hypothetical protein
VPKVASTPGMARICFARVATSASVRPMVEPIGRAEGARDRPADCPEDTGDARSQARVDVRFVLR